MEKCVLYPILLPSFHSMGGFVHWVLLVFGVFIGGWTELNWNICIYIAVMVAAADRYKNGGFVLRRCEKGFPSFLNSSWSSSSSSSSLKLLKLFQESPESVSDKKEIGILAAMMKRGSDSLGKTVVQYKNSIFFASICHCFWSFNSNVCVCFFVDFNGRCLQ